MLSITFYGSGESITLLPTAIIPLLFIGANLIYTKEATQGRFQVVPREL